MTRKRYPQIADDLRVRILSGELTPGTQLPAQAELQAEYRASLMTVRRALDELVREGLIVTVDKVGVFVCREERRYVLELGKDNPLTEFSPLSPSITDRFLAAYVTEGRPLSQTVHIVSAEPPAGVAARLQLTQPVVLRHRVMYAGKERISIANTYIPKHVAEGTVLEQPDLVEHDMIGVLDQAGVNVTDIDEETFVRPANSEESREMGWETGKSLLGQMFTAHAGDEAVACWVSLMPSGRCILARRHRMQFPRPAICATG